MPRTARPIDNSMDVIDSRDVIARIAELQAEQERLAEARAEAEASPDRAEDDLVDFQLDEDDAAELAALLALQEEAESAPDWTYGTTLIRDDYFEDHAREMASDLYGKEVDEAYWPFTHIDWTAAADALKMDYTSVDFDGVTYWVR